MKKCCECKKIVWPWQESSLAFNIHSSCHQQIINDAAKDHKIRILMNKEIKTLNRPQNIYVL